MVNARPLLRYAFVSVLRNRSRSLYAVLGIALSTALVAGSLIAVDTSASRMFHMAIDPTMVDFVGNDRDFVPSTGYNFSRSQQVVDEIQRIEGIKQATYWVRSNNWILRNEDGKEYLSSQGGSYLAFVDTDCESLLAANNIRGEMPVAGSVAIPESVAQGLDLGLGDEIVCSLEVVGFLFDPVLEEYVYDIAHLNLTFPVSRIWTQDKSVLPYEENRPDLLDESVVYINNIDGLEPVVFDLSSYPSVMNASVLGLLSSTPSEPSLAYLVWTDRDTILSPADVQGSIEKLVSIEARINEIGDEYAFHVGTTRLVNQLRAFESDFEALTYLFIVLSIPVSVLGVYLSVVGVDMGANSRRREAGLLRARGATDKFIRSYLAIEAVVLGATASIAGLLVGVAASRIMFGDVGASSLGQVFSDFSWADLGIRPVTAEIAGLFGTSLMFLASLRSFRSASAVTVRESIRHHSDLTSRDDYSPEVDITLVVFSLFSIACMLLTADAAQDRGWSWMTETVLGLVLMWGILIFPLMPFFLSFGAVRLLTRGSRKLYSGSARLVKPWTRELHHLVRRNVLRNPRRASSMGVIIALALASGLFVSITMESTIEYQRSVVAYGTGSDIKIDGHWHGSREFSGRQLDLSKLSVLSAIDGVRASSSNILVKARLPYGGTSADLWVAVINSTDYERTVEPNDGYFSKGDSRMLDKLRINGNALVTEEALRTHYLAVGDPLLVNVSHSSWSQGNLVEVNREFSLKMIGTVKGLPGLATADVFVDRRSMEDMFGEGIDMTDFYVISVLSLSNGADSKTVEDAAASVFAEAGLDPDVLVAKELISRTERDPYVRSTRSFLSMEYTLCLAMMFVGVSLLIFVSVGDRERELACIMARGSSDSQMRRILMGESIAIMVPCVLIGATVGLLASFLFNTLNPSPIVPRTMEFGEVSWVLLAVSVISVLTSSLLATVRAGRVRLAEILRIRGG